MKPNLLNAIHSWHIWLSLFAITTGLLAYALYTEHYLYLIPCALCMTQRFFFLVAGLTGLVAAIHHPRHLIAQCYNGLILLSLGLGAATAGRQVWLQQLPEDQVPACGPSLGYMLETLPIAETFKTLMMGDGNCAEVQWTFLGLSMPTWSLIAFIGLLLLSFVNSVLLYQRANQA